MSSRSRSLSRGSPERQPRSRSPVRKYTGVPTAVTVDVDDFEAIDRRHLREEFDLVGNGVVDFVEEDDEGGFTIEYGSREEALLAVATFDQKTIDGQLLDVYLQEQRAPPGKLPSARGSRSKSPRRKHLFIVASTFDEGFDSADALFWADSVKQVAKYMLDSVRRYIDGGKKGMNKFYSALESSNWIRILFSEEEYMDEIYIEGPEERSKRLDRILQSIPLTDFIDWIDSTYVDGDSNNKISISEYDESSIKTL